MIGKTHELTIAEMRSITHTEGDLPTGTRLMFYGAKVAPPGWRIVEHGAGGLICEKETDDDKGSEADQSGRVRPR